MNLFLLDDGRLRSGWRFVVCVFLVIAANFIAGNISVLIAGSHYRLQEVIYRPLLMVLELAAFFFITKLFDQPESSPWAYIGLPARGWLRESLVGMLLGFGMVTAAVAIIGSFLDLRIKIDLNIRSSLLGLVVIGVMLTAAMAEELTFRGYPFQRLVEGFGATGSIVVLSCLFGTVHMQNPHVSDNRWVQIFAFSNTLLIGVVLALGYLKTKALWFPWGLHFGWNAALGLIYGLPVSGMDQFAVIVKSKAAGPEWLLGGSYGLEGGMLGTLVILLGLAYVLILLKPVSEVNRIQAVAERLSNGIQPDSGV
jgi:membrane protease YdiL (CAAX protease family)